MSRRWRWFASSSLAVLLFACAGAAPSCSTTRTHDRDAHRQHAGDVVRGGGAVAGNRTRKYYYLPVELRVAARPDGTPEFLFLKFTTEARDGVSGGLMHFLMEWGLTPDAGSRSPRQAERRTTPTPSWWARCQWRAMGTGPSRSSPRRCRTRDGDVGDDLGQGAARSRRKRGGRVTPRARRRAAPRRNVRETRSITDVSVALNYAYRRSSPPCAAR